MRIAMTGMTVGQRKLRIELDRAVEQVQRFGRGKPIAVLIKPGQPPQVDGLGIEALRLLVLGTFYFGCFNRRGDRPNHALGHLILQIEDIAEPAVKTVGPKMGTSGGIDELSRDTDSVCRLANAPFQHVPPPQLTSHLLHFDRAPLVSETRVAGYDE